MKNVNQAYNEVCKNTKNINRVEEYQSNEAVYKKRIYEILKNKKYEVGKSYEFYVKEPKLRKIVSQSMMDKIVNHLVSRYIIYPAVLSCLIDTNCASRKGFGTQKGLELAKKYRMICNSKYGKKYYVLKCDIHHFFASIDHDILKNKIRRKIKDKDALDIIDKIIDNYKEGLEIGSMSSQIMAIYFLNDLDHYIKEKLKIKYYVRYQDDMLIFHESKKYLIYVLNCIRNFLKLEKLDLNNKTRIFKSTDNFVFLGRKSNGRYARYHDTKRKIKKRYYMYKNDKINYYGFICSLICYENFCK